MADLSYFNICTFIGVVMSGSVRMLPVNKDSNDEGTEKVQRRGSAVLSLRSDGVVGGASPPKCMNL